MNKKNFVHYDYKVQVYSTVKTFQGRLREADLSPLIMDHLFGIKHGLIKSYKYRLPRGELLYGNNRKYFFL